MKFNELQKRIISSLILLPISIILIFTHYIIFIPVLFLITIFSLNEWKNINKKKKSSLIINFGYLVIIISIFSSIFIRGLYNESSFLLLWILLICIFSDIGGYIFGKTFKGPKLTKISPNKTYSGMIGSFIFSIIPIILLENLTTYEIIYQDQVYLINKYIVISLFLSLVCQSGDILISYFKRLNKIKNTGNLIPGHGGILDRIDGIIFVLIFASIFKFINLI
ncbi:MAG: hypothetical protein CBC24_00055 [Candidatus Pelagibacter sp. TMED64]|nr:phosphatidate cytidylyltransferase [Candidatus Pelagibacter sp.]OUU67976.1 MAG: hypothetical protein CBC24_00055 [Candidatus Pelagibacter sp. TMED64]